MMNMSQGPSPSNVQPVIVMRATIGRGQQRRIAKTIHLSLARRRHAAHALHLPDMLQRKKSRPHVLHDLYKVTKAMHHMQHSMMAWASMPAHVIPTVRHDWGDAQVAGQPLTGTVVQPQPVQGTIIGAPPPYADAPPAY